MGNEPCDNRIMVSVVCLVYNHEPYLKKTLDSFLIQKTDFKYEVIIHDDASTDHSADIIRSYQNKYPDIIKPIYQTENQYRKRTGIIKTFVLPRTQGKYLAWCEGDDYWTDENKLQQQVEALEQHPECSACISKVQRVGISGEETGRYFPVAPLKEGRIPSDDFIRYCLDPAPLNGFPYQLSGFMTRREIACEYFEHPPAYRKCFHVGDIPMFLYVGLKGDVYYIDTLMSSYRTGNPDSWIGKAGQDRKKRAEYFLRKADAYAAFDACTDGKYHESAAKAIGYAKAGSYLQTRDLRSLKTKDMREYYRMLSFKEKCRLYRYHYIPQLETLEPKIKSKIKTLVKRFR